MSKPGCGGESTSPFLQRVYCMGEPVAHPAQRAAGKKGVGRRRRDDAMGIIFLVVSMILSVHVTWADDAIVLPSGVFRVSADARFSLPITKRFTPSGGTEDLAADFNRDLNSTAFSDLRLVETAFHLPAGSATFGRSVVDFERHIQIYSLQAAYGLTDRLSLGVRFPYWTPDIR